MVKDAEGPWGGPTPPREPPSRRPGPPLKPGPPKGPGEPAFNAPWPALLLAGLMVAGYLAKLFLLARTPALNVILSRAAIEEGRWGVLLTSLFVQNSVISAVISTAFALTLGTPIARCFGGRPLQGAGLILFYIACGLVGEAVFLAIHWEAGGLSTVGSSGALSGLIGGASRLLGRPQEEGPNLAPIFSRPVIVIGAAWLVMNLIVAIAGLAANMSQAQVGIEPQVAGFVGGVLLVGVFARLLRPR